MAINFDHQRDRISSSSQSIAVNTTGALVIPVGTTAQQPTGQSGQIRFNSELAAFEGYNGTGWRMLDGVHDLDNNTYITAEEVANDNTLRFYTNGVERFQIDSTGDFKFGNTLTEITIDGATGNTAIGGSLAVTGITNINDVTDSTTITDGALVVDGGVGIAKKLFVGTDLDVAGNVQIDGTLTVDGIATLKAGASGTIAVGDDATDNVVFNADINSDFVPDTNGTHSLGSLAQNWNKAFLRTLDSSTGTITIDTTGSIVLPVGTTAERPITLAQGMVRYNTTDSTFEGYDGGNWGSLGGVKDIDQDTYIEAEETSDDDTLRFYTAGTQRATIDATGNTTFGGNVQIDGTLTVDGIATLKAGASGTIAVGDNANDNVVFNADINSNFVPDTNGTYSLGSLAQNWNTAFLRTLDSSTDIITVDINGALILPVGTVAERPGTAAQGMIRYNSDDTTFEGYDGTAWGSLGGVKDVDQDTYISAETTPGADNDELDFYTGGVERMSIGATGQITAAAGYTPTNPQDLITKDFAENNIQATAGTPTDSSWQDGAYLGFNDADKVADVLDELNESLENVRNNTFVRSVTFTAAPTSGGAGTTVTLNLVVDGNSNRYDIDWGDGSTTTATSDNTPSHTYTSNVGSPYTVVIRAFHNGSIVGSAGSEASSTRTNYIIIYTADPVTAFDLYRAPTGGTTLAGNNLYVIEGDALYMRNNTTNTTMADVTYTMNWGDGTAVDNIANDSADGGVSGSRLIHTWGASTSSGIGRDTLNLTLASHTTANPASIPTNTTLQLKVYDPNIATPNGLNTKTIAFANDEGSSPKLASGFTDLTGSTSLTAGNNVDLTNNTTGQLETSVISTYAYDANNGTLDAKINGSVAGSKALTGGDDSGTYGDLTITDEEDYNLLNAGGSATSFNSSIYHPGLYSGFKAKLSAAAVVISKGINSFQLSHSTTGDTNLIEFVKDDITNSPTVTAGTVTENNAGTYRYISGIPYYNSGSPSLTLSGVTVNSFIGQAYRDTTSVVNVTSGTNLEGTSQSAIGNQNYTYAQIDGATSFLTGGIPNADTGNGTPYTLGDMTVNITSSNVRTIENIRHRANNIYGASGYQTPSANIQVHKASQTGISEIAIDVSSSLGSTYNDDAVRIFDFSADTTNNPTIPGATNFYTNSVYSESADPGVVGTKEATIRLGVLEHNVDNYSTGYLPVGPNRSGDTGTQYITIAFRRTVVANFNINITSGTGVSGVWIAAPGTTVDNTSTINGWLECGTQYGGAGVPGANTGSGGNGSNGCASTGGDIIASNTALSGSYTMTLGTENLTNATSNVALVRIALAANQNVTALSIT